MKIRIYWSWFKIFNKNWYSGLRPRVKNIKIYDLGPLTVVLDKESQP